MSRLDHFTPLPRIRIAVIELISSFQLLIRTGHNLALWA